MQRNASSFYDTARVRCFSALQRTRPGRGQMEAGPDSALFHFMIRHEMERLFLPSFYIVSSVKNSRFLT
jgi:hypothetical protein